jgi:hypothetical protein
MPSIDADEAARWRIVRKISGIYRIDCVEVSCVCAIDVAFGHLVERRARCLKAGLHLFKHDLSLPLNRKAFDLSCRTARRDIRNENEISYADNQRYWDVASLIKSRQRFDVNDFPFHGGLAVAGTLQCSQLRHVLSPAISSAATETPALVACEDVNGSAGRRIMSRFGEPQVLLCAPETPERGRAVSAIASHGTQEQRLCSD